MGGADKGGERSFRYGTHSLFWKIYLSMVATLFIPMMIFNAYNMYMNRQLLTGERSEGVKRNIEWGARLVAERASRLSDDDLESWLDGADLSDQVRITITRAGRSFSTTHPTRHDFAKYQLVASATEMGTTAEISVSVAPAAPFDSSLVRIASFAVVALLGIAISYRIVRSYVDPLIELRRVTAHFAGGDFSARAGSEVTSHTKEAADLGTTFNWMADNIEGVISSQKRLLSDISHEIRSPLQRMDVAVTLARSASDASSLADHLDRVETEIKNIDEMVEELLTLARAENQRASHESTDISSMLREAARDAEFEGAMRGITVTSDVEEGVTVMATPALMKRAIGGVVDNAVRYAPTEGRIDISCRTLDHFVVITVSDDGEGVDSSELEDIFEPYYRTDRARSRERGGTGLGLSITKRAVEGCGGSVSATNAPGGGLTVEIRLPLITCASRC